jgi:predicted RNA binding protein YcfA (HicA-like mRNA interferase family)
MLEYAGYRLVRICGSHHYFTKPGEEPFSIPVHHGKMKPYYVREVEKVCQGDRSAD